MASDLTQAFLFKDTIEDQHLAALWAALNANWGRLELMLYMTLQPIDESLAFEWTLDFFSNDDRKREKVKRDLAIKVGADDELNVKLSTAIDKMKQAGDLRNPLIHGAWKRHPDGRIEVQPLRLKTEFTIAPLLILDTQYLIDLERKMENAIQHLASIGAEVLAQEQLRKINNRRRQN